MHWKLSEAIDEIGKIGRSEKKGNIRKATRDLAALYAGLDNATNREAA